MLDMTKVNGVIGGLKQVADTLVKSAAPVITIMLILEVVFGVQIGIVNRIVAFIGCSVKDAILYGFGAFIVYKAIIK